MLFRNDSGKVVGALCFQVPPSTPGTKSAQPAEPEEEEQEPAAEPAAKPAPRFAKFDRNNFKCTRCLKVCTHWFPVVACRHDAFLYCTNTTGLPVIDTTALALLDAAQ